MFRKEMSNTQKIQARHEARMTLVQVVLPVAGLLLASDSELAREVKDDARKVYHWTKEKVISGVDWISEKIHR